jgi:hypothetical protein
MAFDNTKAMIMSIIHDLEDGISFAVRERIRGDRQMEFFSKHVRETLEEISKKLQDLVELINSKTH